MPSNHPFTELCQQLLGSCVTRAQAGWRRVCAAAVSRGVPIPTMSAALEYFDGYRTENLPANLLQALRFVTVRRSIIYWRQAIKLSYSAWLFV